VDTIVAEQLLHDVFLCLTTTHHLQLGPLDPDGAGEGGTRVEGLPTQKRKWSSGELDPLGKAVEAGR
jgi:hypothetical protein